MSRVNVDRRSLVHARSLLSAISLAVACAPRETPVGNEVVVQLPATPRPETSQKPAPIVSAAPAPAPVPDDTSAPVASAPVTKPAPTKATKPPAKRTFIIEGRPFIVDGATRLARSRQRADWTLHVDIADAGAAKDELARHYTTWALAEHASIASFARFALQLLALGAPADLVERATAAMADEIRHASFGFGLVRAISGRTIGPTALPINRALDGETTLESVLRLVVREGMVGETLAALEVRVAADLVEIPTLRDALIEIAQDESRHAELAYAFAAWALARAPELERVIDEEIASCDLTAPPTPADLERWGILDEARRLAVRERGFEDVVVPASARLTA